MSLNDHEKERHAVNIAIYLKRVVKIAPYKRAVVYPAGRDKSGRVMCSHLTFLQLDRESDCLANGMEEAGITSRTRTIRRSFNPQKDSNA